MGYASWDAMNGGYEYMQSIHCLDLMDPVMKMGIDMLILKRMFRQVSEDV